MHILCFNHSELHHRHVHELKSGTQKRKKAAQVSHCKQRKSERRRDPELKNPSLLSDVPANPLTLFQSSESGFQYSIAIQTSKTKFNNDQPQRKQLIRIS